jgi:hypothetical protein
VYAAIIAALNIVSMFIIGLGAALSLLAGRPAGLVVAGLQLAMGFLIVRLALGLAKGERLAVCGLCVMFAMIVVLVLVFVSEPVLVKLLVLAFPAVLYLPPLVAAFRRWDCFHQRFRPCPCLLTLTGTNCPFSLR